MRKILKVVGAIVGLLVVAVLGLLGFLIAKTPAQRPPTAEKIQVTPAMLARGDYLVNHVMPCLQCHSDHEESIYGMPLKQETRGRGGHAFGPDEGVPGFVQAQNITPDPETGKADWTDGEILRAMREGVSKDGHALFPMMPYPQIRIIGDDDAKAIVAYIRTLKPVHNVIKPRDLAFPVNLLVKNVPQPLAGPVVTPDDAKD